MRMHTEWEFKLGVTWGDRQRGRIFQDHNMFRGQVGNAMRLRCAAGELWHLTMLCTSDTGNRHSRTRFLNLTSDNSQEIFPNKILIISMLLFFVCLFVLFFLELLCLSAQPCFSKASSFNLQDKSSFQSLDRLGRRGDMRHDSAKILL